ncbi:MAG: hypothetical protein ACRC6E_03720 [Fusobacteriaceae bacterium]
MIVEEIKRVNEEELKVIMADNELLYVADSAYAVVSWRTEETDDIFSWSISELAEGIYVCGGKYYLFD